MKSSFCLLVVSSAMLPHTLLRAADSGVPGIAEREIARRIARIEDASKAVEKGDRLYSEGNYESSLGEYRAAKDIFDQMPNAPFIKEWRDFSNLKFADCAVVVAREKAKVGDYPAAKKLLEEAELAVPGHREARIFTRHLEDPDRWPRALTPQHVENVQKVKDGLLRGNSSTEIGLYDQAKQELQDVLRIDPYNVAARRAMEAAEQKRAEYFDAARDQQRARMLNLVSEAWEEKPPVAGLSVSVDYGRGTDTSAYLTKKMQQIIFPQVSFAGASIEEAVEFLRVKSRDLDISEADPAKKGVNIILKAGDTPSTAQITLDLKDVPMVEALRYVTELAGMKYKVEPYAILVVPLSESTVEQYTRIYKVPPDFLTQGGSGAAAPAAAAPADPFAPGGAAPTGANSLLQRATALDILKSQGIPFPEGATAIFNAVTSQLIVKNTQPNLDLVETFVDSIIKQGPKQIYITSKFVEVSQKNTDELGFDWLLGTIGRGNAVQGGGGGLGNSSAGNLNALDFPSNLTVPNPAPPPAPPTIVNPLLSPLTRGNRSGTNAITGSAIDALLNPSTAVSTVAPGVFSIAGVLTDPQFGVVMRALAQKKGADLMSAPSVTTKSGQRATIEVVREFIYPTEFDPPQVPQGGGGLGGGGAAIVTPTTPTAFEMRPTGVRMEVDPTVGADGYTIDLNLAPEVTEFDGFINYGTPIFGPTGVLLTANVINQPVFSVRKVQTSVTVWDGQTVALGGLIREDIQKVDDKVPIIGDIPLFGRLFKSQSEDHFKRNLMIFVTATLIDPSGQHVRPSLGGSSDATSGGTVPGNPILPTVGN